MMKQRFIAYLSLGLAIASIVFCGQVQSSPEGWTEDTRLTFTKKGLRASKGVGKCIRTSGNVIYVVGSGLLEEDQERTAIYIWESKDNGRTWSEPFRVSSSSGCASPALYIYQNSFNIIWEDYRDGDESEIYFIRSSDGGKTWGDEIRISSNAVTSYYPDVLADNNGIHIVWVEIGDEKKVYYKRSEDDGVNWTADLELEEGDRPCFLGDGNNISVFYEARNTNSSPPYYSVFCRKSADGGKTWGAADELFEGSGQFVTKDSNGRIDLGWSLYDTAADMTFIRYSFSDDGCLTWSTPQIISDSSSGTGIGDIISDGNAVSVVWAGNGYSGEEIFCNYSIDNGETWGGVDRLTYSSGISVRPSNIINGGAIHVVWSDGRNYVVPQLYYKRYDPTVPTGEPSSPQVLGENNNYINTTRLTFYWTKGTVVDNESEIVGYNFQVGTYPNGTDVYDGEAPLLGRLTITGENGKAYYARVQAMTETDRLSGWSEWSGGVTVKAQAETVTSIIIEPNPCSLSRDGKIYFKNLAAGARVDVYTVSGKILKKITDSDGDGIVEWDCKNKHGYKVNRGVYLYQASGGGKTSGKFAVVR